MIRRLRLSCMGCSPENLDAIVISRGHYDHTGGLALVLHLPGQPAVYLHPSAIEDKFSPGAGGAPRRIGMPKAARKALSERPGRTAHTRAATELAPGIAVTGEVARIHPLEDGPGRFFRDAACRIPDRLPDDRARWIQTAAGLVAVLGCAHAGVINTLDYIARFTGCRELYGFAGGLHLGQAGRERPEATAASLAMRNVQVIAAYHRTGLDAQAFFRSRFGSRVRQCAVGTRLEFPPHDC